MRDLEKRLERLEAARESKRKRIVTLIVNDGEDAELVEEQWRRDHPHETADGFVLMSIFSEPPRLGFASRESVLEALPHVKAFALQADYVEVDVWRGWARAAGIDWDAVMPHRTFLDASAYVLTRPEGRPYQPPQSYAPRAPRHDLDVPATPVTPDVTRARAREA